MELRYKAELRRLILRGNWGQHVRELRRTTGFEAEHLDLLLAEAQRQGKIVHGTGGEVRRSGGAAPLGPPGTRR